MTPANLGGRRSLVHWGEPLPSLVAPPQHNDTTNRRRPKVLPDGSRSGHTPILSKERAPPQRAAAVFYAVRHLMSYSHDIRLVALSIAIAIMASGAALDLAGRVTAAYGQSRRLWLLGGAFAMGTGIWSMHYIGMLAFRLPFPVLYHIPTVLASWLLAVCASAVALFVVSGETLSLRRACAGSVAMGMCSPS